MKISRTKITFIAVLAAIIVCLAFFITQPQKTIKSVILISIDTCRADYLSCYGYKQQTTPNIDALAGQGFLFENAVAPAPLTLPSHASMLTGTIPPYHQVHDNYDYKLSVDKKTLAEILKENGFYTGSIISSFVLNKQFGLDQGFDTYDDKFETKSGSSIINERIGSETSNHAISWIRQNKENDFFLFLHYFDPHYTWQSPEPYKSQFKDSPYAGEIAFTDHCIGQVIDELKKQNLFDSTLIVITADHGESLGEHGESYHGYYIYQPTIKVPLIFKVPKMNEPVRFSKTVGLVDIVPTICGLLDIETDSENMGRDLSRHILDTNLQLKNLPYYIQSFQPTKYDCNPLLGVVDSNFKYIETTRPELYNMPDDPKELNNLFTRSKKQYITYKNHLETFIENSKTAQQNKNNLTTDPKTMANLKSLGYASGGAKTDSLTIDPKKSDPKDFIEFLNMDALANYLVSKNDLAQIRSLCKEMMRIKSDYPMTYHYLGTVELQNENYKNALFPLSKYVELKPSAFEGYNDLALAYFMTNKIPKAIDALNKAIELQPDYTEAHINLGRLYAQSGNSENALKHLNTALNLSDDEQEKAYIMNMLNNIPSTK